jgi:hypothetical protein
MENPERSIKTIVFDSDVEEWWSETFLNFISDSNTSHSLNCETYDNPLTEKDVDSTQVRFPNGVVLQFPHDLYLLFESTDLSKASPRFVSTMGFVITKECFITWKSVMSKLSKSLFGKNISFFKMLGVTIQKFSDTIEKVITPVVLNVEG